MRQEKYLPIQYFSKHLFVLQVQCRNYLKVVLLVENELLLVCGTNADEPACRYYTVICININGHIFNVLCHRDGQRREKEDRRQSRLKSRDGFQSTN